MSMNPVSVDREFLEHCLSVMRGVGELCQPIPRKSEDDPTEYCGGQALAELAVCYNKLLETIAYAEQAALTQAEQQAGRDLAAHIAEAIEQERSEIVPADLYRQALEEVIRDAIKTFRQQAQEAAPPANAEAVRLVAAFRGFWVTNESGMLERCVATIDAIEKACRDADTFLAQHGGRGDE